MEVAIKFKKFAFLLLAIGLMTMLTCCQPIQNTTEPVIIYNPPIRHFQCTPSAFPPFSTHEKQQSWANEIILGDQFAREIDLYRAITCYKRALFTLPEDEVERRLQIDYNIILCYYLGHKYQETANTFEESNLVTANPLFPAYNNLLLILYDTYQRLQQEDQAQKIFEIIQKCSLETAQDLTLFSAIKEGRLDEIQSLICVHRDQELLQDKWNFYTEQAKSPGKARALNAILPGAGYYYIGQKKSALTSFIINSLFTAAAYQFFHRGYVAAGLITSSLELGWYLGGINGAGLEAQEFNTRLYEWTGQRMLTEHQLFPVLMFETTF